VTLVVLGKGVAPRGLPPAMEPVPVRDLGRRLRDGAPARLLALGDDADVALVFLALVEARAHETGVAFSGSTSGLARMFALDASVAAGVERVEHGSPYRCDLAVIESGDQRRAFLSSIGAGVFASPGRLFPWRHPVRSAPIVIETGRRRIEHPGRGVIVANGQNLGAWTVAPRRALMDGTLEAQVVNGTLPGLSRLKPALHRGLHTRSPDVRRASSPRIEVAIPESWPVTVDGRKWRRGPFVATVSPGACRLLV
jgi:diacylglycerol kinase family enzyme